ncbi:hypothetical protein PPERSA_11167 [Pseudocohnilembus persalinus]|uniref:Ion transport domain-containing protein n=1 Tax=Pseudocohnilembus persalinus TaxID=266149 RepID=A0A0V0QZC6_PSEPJ|nr:hypothetical protein PPERSA_11167 [Pseudocohnilembus persalinus]|eukprot:KRX07618.1 hypothetical protein PPERSA_11167 [Pseudocohnilembus persalinus]
MYSDQQSNWRKYFDIVFAVIFIFEFLVKSIALGFAFEKNTYLRDGWNIIDFIVVITSIISFFPQMYNLSAIRTTRILRPLRTINYIEKMRILIQSIIESLPDLGNVVIFLSFIVILFGILGLQLFAGVFENRCRFTPEPVDGKWEADASLLYLCDLTDDNSCPEFRYCRNPGNYKDQNISFDTSELDYEEFNYGYTRFDNILLAIFTIFQSLTTEGWTTIITILIDTYSPLLVYIYFCFLIVLGSFFVVNLILAVVNESFIDQQNKQIQLRKQKKLFEQLEYLKRNSKENNNKKQSIQKLQQDELKQDINNSSLLKSSQASQIQANNLQRLSIKSVGYDGILGPTRMKDILNNNSLQELQFLQNNNNIDQNNNYIPNKLQIQNLQTLQKFDQSPYFPNFIGQKSFNQENSNTNLIQSELNRQKFRGSNYSMSKSKKYYDEPLYSTNNYNNNQYAISNSNYLSAFPNLNLNTNSPISNQFGIKMTSQLSNKQFMSGSSNNNNQNLSYRTNLNSKTQSFKEYDIYKQKDMIYDGEDDMQQNQEKDDQMDILKRNWDNRRTNFTNQKTRTNPNMKEIDKYNNNNQENRNNEEQDNMNQFLNPTPKTEKQNKQFKKINPRSPDDDLVSGDDESARYKLFSPLTKNISYLTQKNNFAQDLTMEIQDQSQVGIMQKNIINDSEESQLQLMNYRFAENDNNLSTNQKLVTNQQMETENEIQSKKKYLIVNQERQNTENTPLFNMKTLNSNLSFGQQQKQGYSNSLLQHINKKNSLKSIAQQSLKQSINTQQRRSQLLLQQQLLQNQDKDNSFNNIQKLMMNFNKVDNINSVYDSNHNNNNIVKTANFLSTSQQQNKPSINKNFSSQSNHALFNKSQLNKSHISLYKKKNNLQKPASISNKLKKFIAENLKNKQSNSSGNSSPSYRKNVQKKEDNNKNTFRNKVKNIVNYSGVFIAITTLFILANTITLALDKYPQSQSEQSILEIFNIFFTSVFTLEMVIKLYGLGFIGYIRDKFNIFDGLLVILSLVEIIIQELNITEKKQKNFASITAFRTLRLFRIFKLARSWVKLRHLLVAIGKTMKQLLYFMFLVLLFIIISSLLGMELFAYKIRFNSTGSVAVSVQEKQQGFPPRNNFDTFFDSVVTIFVLLTNENWNSILYKHMRDSNLR